MSRNGQWFQATSAHRDRSSETVDPPALQGSRLAAVCLHERPGRVDCSAWPHSHCLQFLRRDCNSERDPAVPVLHTARIQAVWTQAGAPKQLSTPLDATILSSFAIFRRSALPGEELFGLKPGGDGLDRELSKVYELSGYYPAYVRQLTRLPDGRRYFVIPAYGRPEAVVPAHCLAGGVRERRALVEEHHRRLVEPVDCIIEVGGSKNAPPQGCEPFAAVGEADRVFQPDLHKEPIVELVPDGVASVRIAYRETPTLLPPLAISTLPSKAA